MHWKETEKKRKATDESNQASNTQISKRHKMEKTTSELGTTWKVETTGKEL